MTKAPWQQHRQSLAQQAAKARSRRHNEPIVFDNTRAAQYDAPRHDREEWVFGIDGQHIEED